MSRLPIRVRLTLAFAIATSVLLGAVGLALYVRLGDALLEQIDSSLGAQADALTPAVSGRTDGAGELASPDDERFTQVVDGAGKVSLSSTIVSSEALLSAEQVERGRREAFVTETGPMAALEGAAARLLVRPLEGGEVLVVGASLDDREEALAGLAAQFLIVGPVALLLMSGAGYLLAGAALRPVEAMRTRAAAVSSARPGQRLPLPAARDEIFRLGETLNVMLDRLEGSIVRERRFVADASHELRTPLAVLQTELELARRRPRSIEELERALDSAAEEVERLNRLAEDLLTLARVNETEGLALSRSSFPWGELADGVVRRFAPRARAEGREIVVELEDPSATVEGDRARLEQALGNLVDNALRHGGGTVRIGVDRGESAVEIVVRDEGAGFPAAFLPRAFERFARADDARGGGGAGLGLAIVDAIARAHGGSARAWNEGGGGAVAIVLPRAG